MVAVVNGVLTWPGLTLEMTTFQFKINGIHSELLRLEVMGWGHILGVTRR